MEFKGCRGVVERCVVEVTLVLRVRCGNGTVAKKALLNVSVLNVNHPPDESAFLDPIINLIIPRFDM